MGCPNPFAALQTAQPPSIQTLHTPCNWTAYPQSDAAPTQGNAYLREYCVAESIDQPAFQCPLLDQYCNSAELVFASAPLLAMCSLAANLTIPVNLNSTSMSNQTMYDNGQALAQKGIFETSSVISTGLISYCTLVSACSQSTLCSVASILSTNGHLSREGMTKCWHHLCSAYHATINPDFGGFGMILSYLTQLSVALLNLIVTMAYHLVKIFQRHKGQQQPQVAQNDSPSDINPHLRNFLRYLSEFHKLQCYYSITLQIATLIALYGPLSTTHSIRNPFDEAFLLLLSINGILPIALILYALALFGKVSAYHISLSSLSAILATDTGITIVKLLSEPYGSAQRSRGSYIDWSPATGGLAPEVICGRRYEIRYPKKLKPEKIFMVGAVLCDALMIGVILRWLWTTYPRLWPFESFSKSTTHDSPLSPSHRSVRRLEQKATNRARIAGHTAAGLVFLFCTSMEFFFFYQMLVPQYDRIVNFRDWGFGQIVGIAVWAVVITDLARHEIALLWRIQRGASKKLEASV